MTTQQHTSNAGGLDWLEFLRAGADQHKPTFRQLLAEGLSKPAIETLFIARDGISAGSTATEVADFLRFSQEAYPIAVADVWPDGTPEHWCQHAEWFEGRQPFCRNCGVLRSAVAT